MTVRKVLVDERYGFGSGSTYIGGPFQYVVYYYPSEQQYSEARAVLDCWIKGTKFEFICVAPPIGYLIQNVDNVDRVRFPDTSYDVNMSTTAAPLPPAPPIHETCRTTQGCLMQKIFDTPYVCNVRNVRSVGNKVVADVTLPAAPKRNYADIVRDFGFPAVGPAVGPVSDTVVMTNETVQTARQEGKTAAMDFVRQQMQAAREQEENNAVETILGKFQSALASDSTYRHLLQGETRQDLLRMLREILLGLRTATRD